MSILCLPEVIDQLTHTTCESAEVSALLYRSSSKADNPSSTATQKAEHASSEDSEAQQSKTAQTHVQHKHEQKQQPAGRAELKAEAVSQQKVNQYADQLVKQYE